jgi:hypothetical protein
VLFRVVSCGERGRVAAFAAATVDGDDRVKRLVRVAVGVRNR